MLSVFEAVIAGECVSPQVAGAQGHLEHILL